MKKYRTGLCLSVLACSLLSANLISAEETKEFDVDVAEYGDLNKLYQEKDQANDSVKIWNDENGWFPNNKKTYGNNAAEPGATVASATTAAPAPAVPSHEIKQRYSVSDPSVAIEELYREMSEQCPTGWQKVSERSQPIPDSKHYYLYYQFNCTE
ncbi:hypothetical protein SIN8267_02435 [Sinobacterium norvegicum]|uniref:Uncharacterized protein n=1 Tax=Sinobacterium norvegicum TaxID=1641715 RepID=A0ABM9AGI1_9GAMM|nr:hypothetical protein [Sinobacterium norvegicum]CAH0992316.1 hypothetical protein SIN8267_02435 [Sinobacterium norvegicum]